MLKGMFIGLLVTLMLLSLTACGDVPHDVSAPTTTTTSDSSTTTTLPQGTSLDTLTFTGRVLEVEDTAALMECIGECTLGDRVWVQLGGVPDVTPQVGQTYTVTYEDMVMLSLPPRVNALQMVATDTNTTSITTAATTAVTTTTTPTSTTTTAVTTATTPSGAVVTTLQMPHIAVDPMGSLNPTREKEIKNALLSMDATAAASYTAEDIRLTYYGTYQGCVVVSIDAPFLPQNDTAWDENIGGYVFYGVKPYDLYVWRGDSFFMLRQVYESAWITEVDLRDINYYWNQD